MAKAPGDSTSASYLRGGDREDRHSSSSRLRGPPGCPCQAGGRGGQPHSSSSSSSQTQARCLGHVNVACGLGHVLAASPHSCRSSPPGPRAVMVRAARSMATTCEQGKQGRVRWASRARTCAHDEPSSSFLGIAEAHTSNTTTPTMKQHMAPGSRLCVLLDGHIEPVIELGSRCHQQAALLLRAASQLRAAVSWRPWGEAAQCLGGEPVRSNSTRQVPAHSRGSLRQRGKAGRSWRTTRLRAAVAGRVRRWVQHEGRAPRPKHRSAPSALLRPTSPQAVCCTSRSSSPAIQPLTGALLKDGDLNRLRKAAQACSARSATCHAAHDQHLLHRLLGRHGWNGCCRLTGEGCCTLLGVGLRGGAAAGRARGVGGGGSGGRATRRGVAAAATRGSGRGSRRSKPLAAARRRGCASRGGREPYSPETSRCGKPGSSQRE